MLPLQEGLKQDCITAKVPRPPMAFSVPKRNRKLWCGEGEEGEEGGENVHLLTRTTARGVGKNVIEQVGVIY